MQLQDQQLNGYADNRRLRAALFSKPDNMTNVLTALFDNLNLICYSFTFLTRDSMFTECVRTVTAFLFTLHYIRRLETQTGDSKCEVPWFALSPEFF